MRRLTLLITVLALIAVSAAPALAAPGHAKARTAEATLLGASEVPPVETDGKGGAVFRIKRHAVDFKLGVTGVENVTQAHIHLGPEGANGPVVAFLFGFVDGGVTVDGLLARGTITADDLLGPLEGESIRALVDEMRAGNLYVNVHTVAHPAGEVRGQIAIR